MNPLFCIALLFLSLFSFAEAKALDLPFDLPFLGEEGIRFDTSFEGIDEDSVERYDLEEIARSAIQEASPPQTIAELEAYNSRMAENVRAMLESKGFYDAKVSAELIMAQENDADPLMRFLVNSGERYRISESGIRWEGDISYPVEKKLYEIEPGRAVLARTLNRQAQRIEEKLAANHCFLSLEVRPFVTLNPVDHSAVVMFHVKHGREANFGATSFTGETSVDEEVLRHYLKWQEGQCFQQDKIDKTQVALLRSQLIASARISVAETPDASGQVPVTIQLRDRAHRTITAGASYGTDEGIGVIAGWEHRNLASQAHRFTSRLTLSQLEQGVEGSYAIPFFYHPDQRLKFTGAIQHEDTDTFTSDNIAALAAVERELMDHLTAGVGLGARISTITESGRSRENYGLLYVPLFAEWDSRDDALDAREGLFGRLSFSPYTDVTGQGISFLKTEGTAQAYFTQDDWTFEPTLALKGSYGQINGASTNSVPADLRFYAGGGGSVRGYNYQSIGPIENGEPNGGTIWTEISSEIRLRFSDEYGGVVFVDAGNVYNGDVPDISEELYYSVGVGARYYSPIGPLRLDVGVPLDDVEDDSNFGVYVSIGQSF